MKLLLRLIELTTGCQFKNTWKKSKNSKISIIKNELKFFIYRNQIKTNSSTFIQPRYFI